MDDHDEVMQQIQQWPAWFGLETTDDKDIWCYIIAASGHLEDLAAYCLWKHAGQPGKFEEYRERESLGTLIGRVEKTAVLDASVLRTLREVNHLRNNVAHQHGTYGATESETPQGRPIGMYRQAPVFSDQRARQTLVAMDVCGWP